MATARQVNITEQDTEIAEAARKAGVRSQEDYDAWATGWMQDMGYLEEAEPMFAEDEFRLPMYSLRDLSLLPKTEWLVSGLLEQNQMNLFYGPSGTGKTAVVSEMLWSWVTGVSHWLDPQFRVSQSIPQTERRAIYILLEGIEGYYQRADAWLDGNELEIGALDGVKVIRDSVMLYREGQVPDDPKTWADSLQKLAMNINDYQPQVVVIDTMYRATAGMDVNSPQMSNVVGALQHLINKAELTMVMLHHSPKANKNTAAGHGSLENAVSVRILVDKSDSGGRSLTVKKYRNAEEPSGPLVNFGFRPHRDGFVLDLASKMGGRKADPDKYLAVLNLTVKQAADQLNVTPKTVYNTVGAHPGLTLVGGTIQRLEADDVNDV